MEVSADGVKGGVVISGPNLVPLFARLLELVGPDEGHNAIHLHQLPLLNSQLRVGGSLILNPVTEFFPVKITNNLLKLTLIQLESLTKRIDVNLHQIVVTQRFVKFETGPRLIVHR